MAQKLGYLKESPSQTAGPYVHIGCTPNFCGIEGIFPSDLGATMVNDRTRGERITVCGHIYDGLGAPLRDGLVEVWQADSGGLYNSPAETRGSADPNFTGWGRFPTDMETGLFSFETVKPGPVPFPDGRPQAPHITLWIVARGINIGLHTRMYFGDETSANDEDPVLARVEHKIRVPTLIAPREGDTFTFEIHLQGDSETIFFDV
jgi:protocatechuate 3,4-dioxygenase, alpha subunit